MITSISNTQMKHISMLLKKSKYRNEHRQFVAEGIRMVMETPKERLCGIYVSESLATKDKAVSQWLKGKKYEILSDKLFSQISGTQTPQGLMAVVSMSERDEEKLLSGSSFLLLENLQDPGNLGTILRTAEGAGIDAVFMNKGCVDIYNPKVVRSTMGSLYRVPFLYTDDFYGLMKRMKAKGIKLFAAHLKGANDYYDEDFSGRCGFLVGNEGNGLSDEAAQLAGNYIKIPMSGQLESLNAAMAAGILMYEMKRQKGLKA